MSKTSDMVRKMFAEGDDKRDAGLVTPEDIVRYDDIAYGPDKKWQVLDVYRPKKHMGEKLPVIVSVHGGGWVYGDKERYQFYCMNLAQRGFAVVNFTYRLAPEYTYPAPLEDTNMVFAWIFDHSGEYGLDTEHIFAVGDSAGGHHLSLYSAICANPEYAKEYPFEVPAGFVPRAIALNCGVYEILLDGKDEQTALLMKDYLPQGGSEDELSRINALNHVTGAYPPVFLMTADGDFLKEQAMPLAQKLADKNVPFVYRYYVDPAKALGHVFHLKIRSDMAKLCNDEECSFFRSFMA